MKKHEACHWLNVIIGELQDSRKHYLDTLKTSEKESQIEWMKDQIEEIDKKLQAIDIAGSALTK